MSSRTAAQGLSNPAAPSSRQVARRDIMPLTAFLFSATFTHIYSCPPLWWEITSFSSFFLHGFVPSRTGTILLCFAVSTFYTKFVNKTSHSVISSRQRDHILLTACCNAGKNTTVPLTQGCIETYRFQSVSTVSGVRVS